MMSKKDRDCFYDSAVIRALMKTCERGGAFKLQAIGFVIGYAMMFAVMLIALHS